MANVPIVPIVPPALGGFDDVLEPDFDLIGLEELLSPQVERALLDDAGDPWG